MSGGLLWRSRAIAVVISVVLASLSVNIAAANDAGGTAIVEAGNWKVRNSQTGIPELRAYYTYQVYGQQNPMSFSFPNVTHTAATYYNYAVYPTGTAPGYTMRTCNADGTGCHYATMVINHSGEFDFAGVGGEGPCNNCAFGYSAHQLTQFLNLPDNHWYLYCYTGSGLINITDRTRDQVISACANARFTVNYK